MHPYISVVQVKSPLLLSLKSPAIKASRPNHLLAFAAAPQILSFILIRNIPGYVRSVYSSFFAWFGKISLEVRRPTGPGVSLVSVRLHPS